MIRPPRLAEWLVAILVPAEAGELEVKRLEIVRPVKLPEIRM